MILTDPATEAKFGRALRRRALSAFLKRAAEAAQLQGAVTVLLTGDDQVRQLNRDFRRKDKPTDVLSFPAPAGPEAGIRERLAGDLAISVDTAARQADELGHPLAAELEVLILHGLLHLAGFDHEADNGQMARREKALRKALGLSAGLIERGTQVRPRRQPRSRKAAPRAAHR